MSGPLRIRPYVDAVLATGIPAEPCHTDWPFAVGSTGRPRMRWNGRQAHVARYVLEQKLGRPLTAGALHTCDNPPCWNPAHLYEGTQAANVRDAIERGRFAPPAPRRSLTPAQVRALRAAHEAGTSQRELGRRYGLATAAVWSIVRGLRYQDVS